MNLKDNFVITVSRELGSGGRTVGRILAQKLGVRYCDKDLINSLKEKFGISADALEAIKGKKKSWLEIFERYPMPVPPAGAFSEHLSAYRNIDTGITQDDVFEAESEILKELASAGSCVIAGRSGFFVLEGHPNKLDVFITASLENRIARVMQKQGLSREEAEKAIKKVDDARENFVKRHTGTSRYDLRNYQLVINMDGITEEDAAALILDYIKL